MSDVSINASIILEMGQLRSELGKIPGITEAEAKKMVSALSSQLKRAEQASSKAAKAMKRDFDGRLNDIRQGAGAVFGGIVNDLDDVAKGLGALGPAAGGAVAGFAAFAVSAGLMAKVVYEVGQAAFELDELNKKLDEANVHLPGFNGATEEAVGASQNLNQSLAALSLTLDNLYVMVGNEVAPVLDDLAIGVVALSQAGLDAYDAYLDFRRVVLEAVQPVLDLYMKTSLLGYAVASLSGETEIYKARAIAFIAQLRAQATIEEHARDVADDHTRATKDRTKATEDAIDTAKELAEAEAFQLRMLEETEEADAKLAAKQLKAKEDFYKALAASKDAFLAADKAAMDKADAEEMDRLAERRRAVEETYNFMAGSAHEFLDAIIEAGEGGTEAQKKAAKVAFEIQKALTVAQLIVDSIRATSSTMASIPGPAGIVAAGAVAATYAGLAAKAAAAKPPEFHTGGEVSATLLDGEHVMNRRAARNNREALEEMNRTGDLPGQGDQMSYVVIGGRVVDAIWTRGVRSPRGRSALEKAGRTGRTRVYR